MREAGKGSKPRPFSVNQQTFDDNWDRIFGNKKRSEAEKFDEQVILKNEYYDLED